MARPGPNGRRELQGVQFLRAIAVLLVVAFHAMGILSHNEYFGEGLLPREMYKRGAVGVDLFFVISGFIIAYVSLRDRTLKAKLSFTDFAIRRFVRIIPFLWFAVVFYAAVRFLTIQEFNLVPYLNSMFPVIPVGEMRPNVVWTLRHELWFYAIFGISFLLRRRIPWLVYGWTLLPLAAWLVSAVTGYSPEGELTGFLLSPYNFNFAVGMSIGLAYKRSEEIRARLSLPRSVAWLGILAATLGLVAARSALPIPVVALIAGVVLLFGLAMPTSRGPFARLWELLGNASYSIYLMHNIAILLGIELWVRVIGARMHPVAYLVIAGASILFGVLVHLWVEKPLIRAVNKLVRREQGTQVTPSEPAAKTQ